jgi:hypothetical protein
MAPNFRRCVWGMSATQVRAAEEASFVTQFENGTLLFRGTLIGSDCLIYYDFDASGRLIGGSYQFDSANDVADVADFFELQEMLTQKYGEADNKEFDWEIPHRQRHLESFGDLAKAVATGEVKVESAWRRPDVWVRLVLVEDKERYNAILYLFYYDPSSVQAERESRAERDFDLI